MYDAISCSERDLRWPDSRGAAATADVLCRRWASRPLL